MYLLLWLLFIIKIYTYFCHWSSIPYINERRQETTIYFARFVQRLGAKSSAFSDLHQIQHTTTSFGQSFLLLLPI